jgi:hypothetical protein
VNGPQRSTEWSTLGDGQISAAGKDAAAVEEDEDIFSGSSARAKAKIINIRRMASKTLGFSTCG